MNLLLDTHTLLWALTAPEQLGTHARKALENRENEVFVSSISLWEISLKFSLGKLTLTALDPTDLPEVIEQTGFKLIEPSTAEYAGFHHLPRTSHKDPFDRMLIWQSVQNDFYLVTKDGELDQYVAIGLKTLW